MFIPILQFRCDDTVRIKNDPALLEKHGLESVDTDRDYTVTEITGGPAEFSDEYHYKLDDKYDLEYPAEVLEAV